MTRYFAIGGLFVGLQARNETIGDEGIIRIEEGLKKNTSLKVLHLILVL